MTTRLPRLEIPRRQQRVTGARWLFGGLVVVLGAATAGATGGRVTGALTCGLAVLAWNLVLVAVLRRHGDRPASARLVGLQLVVDSVLTVAAVHAASALTPAVQFLFLFPLFTATLLSPREGLFLTTALCGLGYTFATLLTLGRSRPTADATLAALASTLVVVGALLAAACIQSYLVRTLAGIEADLAASEGRYRELANSLEDEVRQRTGDLRRANEELNARHRELLRLREIDAAIHESGELGLVLQRIVDGVSELVPASQAAIYLRDAGADHLRLARFSTSAERRVAAVEALLGQPLRELRVPLREDTLLEYTVRTREPLLSNDFERLLAGHLRSPRWLGLLPDIVRIFALRTCVALPLVVGERLIGLLALGSRETLGGQDIDRVQAFATQAAMALVRVQQERDLHEQQAALAQAYDELQRSQEQVVNLEKMRAVGEMTSGVAHNFNNALTAILGTAQLVLREELPQPVVHRLKIIERTAQDAALLVQRIRAFTKDEPPQTATIDLNDLVSDAVAMTEPRWRHGIDRVESPIVVDVELRARTAVEVEAAAIREVLINLILNAVNALPKGGKITCRTWDEPDRVLVSVKDTGTGMSEEVRQRCFEPFFTTGGDKGGTGLGLSVAYGIIQRHNGEIRVVSAPGLGTEFIITLPAARSAPAELPGTESDEPGTDLGPLHALVVDDQAMVRQTLADMLNALGHTVTMAADGPEAVRVFDPTMHQLVLTDWGMPGMSGLAVARAVKARSPETRVVLITGADASLPPEVTEAEEIDSRLHKPVALRELARLVGAFGEHLR